MDSSSTHASLLQVKRRQEKYGPNVLGKEKKESLIKIYLHEFMSPVVLMLLTSALVCLVPLVGVRSPGALDVSYRYIGQHLSSSAVEGNIK